MPPTEHAVLGASTSERWMNCAGSPRLTRDLPDEVTKYNTEGTAAHALAERALRTETEAADHVGEVYTVTVEGPALVDLRGYPSHLPEGETLEVPIEWTEGMAEGVQVFVDYVREREEEMGVRATIEERFDLSPLDPPEPMFGTADAALYTPELLEIVDYKNGFILVDEIENSQLLYYGLGYVVKYKVRPERVRVTVVQPRAPHPKGPVRSYIVTWEELVAFKRELFERARATQDPEAPLTPGDWCRFCKARAACPALKEHAAEVVGDLLLEEVEAPTPPEPETMTPDEIIFVLDRADAVTDWIDAVRSRALRLAESGEVEIPGYKVTPKRSHRYWRDEEEVTKYLQNKRLPIDDYRPRSLVSPAQVERVMKRAGHRLTNRFKSLIESRSSGNKLVPLEDPRPALPSTADLLLPPASDPEEGVDNE